MLLARLGGAFAHVFSLKTNAKVRVAAVAPFLAALQGRRGLALMRIGALSKGQWGRLGALPGACLVSAASPEGSKSALLRAPSRRRLFSPPLPRSNTSVEVVKDRQGLSFYEFDADGNIVEKTIPKASLMVSYALHARDVVLLEGFSRRDHPYLQVRHNCLLVALGSIRAVIFFDRILLLKPPMGRIHHVERVSKFAQRLSHVLQKGHKQQQRSNNVPAAEAMPAGYTWDEEAPYVEDDVEYELRALECMLDAACLELRMQSRLLMPVVDDIVDSLNTQGKTLEEALFLLPPTKDALSRFELDASLIRNVLSDLLKSDDDMENMRLSLSHRRDVEPMLGEPEAHRQVELILESYCSQMVDLTQEAYYQRKKLEGAQSVVELNIDSQRNRILQLSLLLSMASVGVSTSAVIVGMFGMNVSNGFESSGVAAFYGISSFAIAMASGIYWTMYSQYARSMQPKSETARPFDVVLERIHDIDELVQHADKLTKQHFTGSMDSMGVSSRVSELVWRRLIERGREV